MDNLKDTLLKDYYLEERIGSGGFGAVYRARQTTINREVAVKIILPGYANNPDFIRRFESEAQLIARLEHPHITPLIDYWRDPNGAYLVMRYLRGGSLRQSLATESYELNTISVLLDQVASALDFAHRGQVIHRDIKPGNILLDEDGNAYLADFGIAKDLQTTRENQTAADAVVGSLDYISPEQARSEPVTPRTDIYSLGVSLYEMITGEHPFKEASSIERLYKHINDPLPDIVGLPDDVCDNINDIIQKATAKDPDKRYPDVLALAVAFREGIGRDSPAKEGRVIEQLTMREHEILSLITDGLTNAQIAEELFITVPTVKWHISQLYKKLEVRNRVQAIVRGRELNLIIIGDSLDDLQTQDSLSAAISLQEPQNPYKGLHAFQITDSRDFFGRDDLVKKLVNRMQEENAYSRFLAVVGPSGSGKSSIVRAGLIPTLWKGALSGSEKWFIVDLIPGKHPLDKLETALIRVAANRADNLREQLQRDERGLLRVADIILPSDETELVIVIDQFEEVFTLLEAETERQHFLDLLRTATTEPRSRVRVVVTLRADYYDRPLHYPEFGDLMRERLETVLPLSAKGLERAVRGPAERVGVTFEQGLVEQIVSQMTYQAGALPLLQYALTELFDRREGRLLTHVAYQQIGGAVGALANRADEIYCGLTEDGQALAHQIYMRLVTLGEGAEDTRRRATHVELLSLTDQTDLMEEIIDQFAEYRLLSLDHDPATRQPTVEVAHEAILREWDRLRQWLNDCREDIREERVLAHAASAWDENLREESYLLTGSRLEQANQWQENTELALTNTIRDYIQTSNQQAQRRAETEKDRIEREQSQERRSQILLRTLVVVFALAMLLSGGFGVFANSQRLRAESSEQDALIQASIGLAAQAVAELDSAAPERGVLLALTALENYPYTPQAERALAQTVYETHRYITLTSNRNRLRSAAFSPDGLFIVGIERSIDIWDAVSGERVYELNSSNETDVMTDVAWTSDGQYLVTSSAEFNNARVWEVETGTELLHYEGHDEALLSVSLSSDNRLALTASADGLVHIWEIATGETVHILSGHHGSVNDAIWSPDNALVATASDDETIRLWDVTSGEEQMQVDAHRGGVNALSWSSDGTRIASAGKDGLGFVWDAESGELVITLIGHDAEVRDIAWSPDSALLATAGDDGLSRVWETINGSELFTLRGGDADVVSVSWAPDSQRLVVGGGVVSRIWDVSTPTLHLVGYAGDEEGIVITNYPYWSPNSDWVGVGGLTDNTYRIWDSITVESLTTFSDVTLGQGFVNPQGTEIFLINPVRIVNLETGDERPFPVPEGYVENVQGFWSPDGRQIIIQNDVNPEYAIYDTETQDLLFASSQRCSFNAPLYWSPDGNYLAQTCFSGELTSVLITEALTAVSVQELVGHTGAVIFADWSPDGTKLATASFDQTVRIWNIETSESLTVFTGHTATVFDVDWSPDGTRLVSGDTAGNVLVWEAGTGQVINRYNVGGSVIFLEWSPDGTRVLTTGVFDAPDIRLVWQSTEELIEYAYDCCVFRELTSEERQQFSLPAR